MFKDVKIISIQVNSRCNLCCKHCVAENLNEINKEADINLMKKRILGLMIIPELSEPPVRTLGATIPENESHIFR